MIEFGHAVERIVSRGLAVADDGARAEMKKLAMQICDDAGHPHATLLAAVTKRYEALRGAIS